MSRQLGNHGLGRAHPCTGSRRACRPDRVQAAPRGHAPSAPGSRTGLVVVVALEKLPKVFPPLYIAMVRAGEVGGQLDLVLLKLSNTLEKQVELRQKVRSAMAYPTIVLCAVVVIITAMMIFIVPIFKRLFQASIGHPPVADADRHLHIQRRRQCLAARRHSSHRHDRGSDAPVDRDAEWQEKMGRVQARPPVFGALSTRSRLPGSARPSLPCCRPACRSSKRSTSWPPTRATR